MSDFRIDINIDQVTALVRRYPDIAREEITAVLGIITARMESETARKTPVGVGGAAGLRGSIFGEVRQMGKKVRGVWGTPLPYGYVVEHGRKPGSMPPVDPIALWAQRKLGVAADVAHEVGLLIAWKIKARGTEGAHMFEEAWEENRQWAMDMLDTIPARITGRVSHGLQ